MQVVLIANSYPMILESMVSHLSKLPIIRKINTCQNEKELRNQLEKELPDILIIDPEILDQKCLGFCSNLLKREPEIRILLITTFSDVRHLQKYFKVGIYGYLPSKAQPKQFVHAVETLAKGQIYLPDFFRKRLVEFNLGLEDKPADQLTTREKEVLKLIIEEHTTKEIAKKLYISSSTAETHRLHLIQKLGVRNTAGLVREGVLKGLYI